MKNNYCSNCGNPKLETSKPCMNCGYNDNDNHHKYYQKIPLLNKIIFYLMIIFMIGWTFISIGIYVEKQNLFSQFLLFIPNNFMDYESKEFFTKIGFDYLKIIVINIWFEPMVIFGLIALIFKIER